MIKDKIEYHKHKIKILQEKYNNLVDSIKNALYDKESYFDDNSKRKPRDEKSLMSAAYCLATMKTNIRPYDLGFSISQAEKFKSEPRILLDYFYIYDKKFENRFGNTPSVLLVRKKNIKVLTETCLKAWKHAVNNSFNGSKTILGFEEWLKVKSCDEIVSILHQVLEDRIDEVNDKKLYIKDVIIIYPDKPFKNYHF